MATDTTSKSGICTNMTGCTLAYSKQVQTVTGPFVCAECGQALQPVSKKAAPEKLLMLIGIGLLCVVFLGGAIIFLMRPHMARIKSVQADSTPSASTPAETPAAATPEPVVAKIPESTPLPVAQTPPATEKEPAPATETAPATPTAPRTRPTAAVPPAPDSEPEVNASSPVVNSESETRSVKAEVLKRIEIMPDLTADKRNKLYQSVDRAHSMTKIAMIPFEAGQTSMSGKVVTDLLTRLHAHELKSILDDPAAVFVILGYADKKGDEQKNLQISKARADSAVNVLQNQGKVLNVLRAVGMGSSTLFGAHHLEKNRLVEVWVVQM